MAANMYLADRVAAEHRELLIGLMGVLRIRNSSCGCHKAYKGKSANASCLCM